MIFSLSRLKHSVLHAQHRLSIFLFAAVFLILTGRGEHCSSWVCFFQATLGTANVRQDTEIYISINRKKITGMEFSVILQKFSL